MGAMALEQTFGLQVGAKPNYSNHDSIIEEVEDLIKVYRNGNVERPTTIPCVTPLLAPDLDVTARDVYIDMVTNIWARIYVPKCNVYHKLPLLVYFHGGGFCVGSTAWKCYHEFLGELSSKARCIIVSVNYRLAPENPLPAAYEDGYKALLWVRQQAVGPSSEYWTRYCDFSGAYLSGDSAGANIAYNMALKIDIPQIRPLNIRGIILVQPFFGGEERTNSEKYMVQSCAPTLSSIAVSDTYWRLALPQGANRDHPWCNPLGENTRKLENMRVMVCIAEEDILRDRNMQLCSVLANAGNKVKQTISEGVRHSFQILDKSQISQTRKQEMISDIVAFVRA